MPLKYFENYYIDNMRKKIKILVDVLENNCENIELEKNEDRV